MRFSLFFAGLALFAATAVTAKHNEIHARAITPASGASFPELQARVAHTTDGALQIRGGPSGSPSRVDSAAVNVNKRTLRTNYKKLHILVRARGILADCKVKLDLRVGNIKKHCGRRGVDINVTIKLVLIELQAILVLLKACLGSIKGCGGGPTPSQPPTNPCQPLDLCWLLIDIIVLIKICFLQLIVLCANVKAKAACAGILIKISACLCEILSSCDLTVGGGILGLVKLNAFGIIRGFGGLSFGGGFGLKSVIGVVGI